jgi:DNA-binding GntR family transcriptional regulator
VQSLGSNPNAFKAIEGHKAIIDAIRAARIDEVAKAINYHLEVSLKNILRFALKENTDKGKIR